MGLFDRIFTAKVKPSTTSWKMSSKFEDEDFVEEPLENYGSSGGSVLLSIAEDLIPQTLRKKVFVAGGFASYFAGITKEYGDIDLFCLDENAFDTIAERIQGDPLCVAQHGDDNPTTVESRGYGRILKFRYEGIKFDLVDSSAKPIQDPETGKTHIENPENIRDLLSLFDFNWAMTGIDFARSVVVCHTGAFMNEPQANTGRIDICLEGTIDRIEKYKDRLVRDPDMPAYNCLIKGLKLRLKDQKRESRAKTATSWY
jgi:hypothetical protein